MATEEKPIAEWIGRTICLQTHNYKFWCAHQDGRMLTVNHSKGWERFYATQINGKLALRSFHGFQVGNIKPDDIRNYPAFVDPAASNCLFEVEQVDGLIALRNYAGYYVRANHDWLYGGADRGEWDLFRVLIVV
eukprot:TRINITY_DN19067_c0_g1_i1.p1 TRINITY_DN19067_c0_g1~~TRINITY_DN19067_c0_g1_i1.p1  ORF type:complete len:134 (+),score=1.85 TRINITY_DN19067_c0_g1_i1:254-655(+)